MPISRNPLRTPYTIMLPYENIFNNLTVSINNNSILINNNIYKIDEIKIFNRPKTVEEKTPNMNLVINILDILLVESTLISQYDLYILKLIIEKLRTIEDIGNILRYMGMGSGSTPSLDDFLIGISIPLNDILRKNLQLILKNHTTLLSKLLLKEVIHNKMYIIDLYNLYKEFFLDDGSVDPLYEVLKLGGSSGLFMAFGLTYGLILKFYNNNFNFIINNIKKFIG